MSTARQSNHYPMTHEQAMHLLRTMPDDPGAGFGDEDDDDTVEQAAGQVQHVQQSTAAAASSAAELRAEPPAARRPVRQHSDPYREHPEWGSDLVNVQIRIPRQLLKAIKHIATDDDQTVSKIILRALYGRFSIRKTWLSTRQEQDEWE
jgi:hypothetical protein